MNALEQVKAPSLYSARNTVKPMNFYCDAPAARSVALQGDFTGWASLSMERRIDGWWFLQVLLPHGHHQYRFLVDGKPQLDPRAIGVGHNDANEDVSIVAVS